MQSYLQVLEHPLRDDAESDDESSKSEAAPATPGRDSETTIPFDGGDSTSSEDEAKIADSKRPASPADGGDTDSGEGDVPNIPADSRGNTSHGFNLAVLKAPPLPPSTWLDENEELITPPKRPAAPLEAESAPKKAKTMSAREALEDF